LPAEFSIVCFVDSYAIVLVPSKVVSMRYWLKLIGIPSLVFVTLIVSGYLYFGSTVFIIRHPLCFGVCPVYTVWIFRDGTVVYHGEQFVADAGIHIRHMDATQVEQFTTSYSELMNRLPPVPSSDLVVSDQRTIHIQLTQNGQTRGITVQDTDGPRVPLIYNFIEKLETAAQIRQWTGGTLSKETP
jgi:hypothetical protein